MGRLEQTRYPAVLPSANGKDRSSSHLMESSARLPQSRGTRDTYPVQFFLGEKMNEVCTAGLTYKSKQQFLLEGITFFLSLIHI